MLHIFSWDYCIAMPNGRSKCHNAHFSSNLRQHFSKQTEPDTCMRYARPACHFHQYRQASTKCTTGTKVTGRSRPFNVVRIKASVTYRLQILKEFVIKIREQASQQQKKKVLPVFIMTSPLYGKLQRNLSRTFTIRFTSDSALCDSASQ